MRPHEPRFLSLLLCLQSLVSRKTKYFEQITRLCCGPVKPAFSQWDPATKKDLRPKESMKGCGVRKATRTRTANFQLRVNSWLY